MKAIKHILPVALCVIYMTACSDGFGTSLNISSGGAETLEAPESSDGDSVLVPLTEEQIRLRKLNAAYSLLDNSVALKNTTESGRILYVEETDTIFWTDNKYLYQKTGDENIALASGIIYSLNLLDGRLYFICSDAVAAVRPMSGEPFVLDLATGELSSLSEDSTSAIYVQPERIFLKQHESYTDADGKLKGRYAYYECRPDGTELIQREDMVLCTDGDWYVTCEQEGESVFNIYYRNDRENIKKLIAVEAYRPKSALLNGDHVYFVEGSWGDTLKRVALDGSGCISCSTNYQYIWDYTFDGDTPVLLTDAYFGTVDNEFEFNRGRITYADINDTQFFSLYSYKGDVIVTTRAGFRKVTPDEYGNYLFSHYKFVRDDT